MTINILGTPWNIVRREIEDDPSLKDCDGYTDNSTKMIVVAKVHRSNGGVEDVEAYMRKVTRHEIVHAFLYESGLHCNSLHFEDGWAMNEELTDWIAIQGPKLFRAWEEAGAL